MLVKPGCDCHTCQSLNRLRGAKRQCTHCRLRRRVHWLDSDGHHWCRTCADLVYAACDVQRTHEKGHKGGCPTCPPEAIVDCDNDVWFPVPGATDSYCLDSPADLWSDYDRAFERGHTLDYIRGTYSPIRTVQYLIKEEDELELAWL